MPSEKSQPEKTTLHPRNINRERYNLKALVAAVPELVNYITPNKFGEDSVNFASPVAVKLLNKALLHHYYGITNWEFPDKNLTPPIPGRADYMHYVADLLMESNFGRMPQGSKITLLDVGTGAGCIYPVLGVAAYGWNFIAADIDAGSLASAANIIDSNNVLKGKITCRLQKNAADIFSGILAADEKVDSTVCNPPFHASEEEAVSAAGRKVKNLSGTTLKTPELNFSGAGNELIYKGGEYGFITNMVYESKRHAKSAYWFTTLVSKQSNLKGVYKLLDKLEALQVKTINMGTGNKATRVVAWTFLSKDEQKQWRETRWK